MMSEGAQDVRVFGATLQPLQPRASISRRKTRAMSGWATRFAGPSRH